eukprot:INCI10703.1.p1 GENE.INCI10703.1~~INCI10703.1.p1  ORF type:complete len:263 (+),score=58.61 INCI10703.1:116-904(+)
MSAKASATSVSAVSAVPVTPVAAVNAAPVTATAFSNDEPSKKKPRKVIRETGGRKTSKKRKAIANDDRIIREALQNFFGNSKGRPKENIRRIKDAFLTVFAMHEEVDATLLARYLHLRSGDMVRRLKSARDRVTHNAAVSMSDWKFHDQCQTRSDSFSSARCEDAQAFWRDPIVSKAVAAKKSKNGSQQKYQFHQTLFLKDAHTAYIQHKRATDPAFSCSITWFSKQRPADVKKLVVKPTGVRKDAAPTATAVVPTEVTADE